MTGNQQMELDRLNFTMDQCREEARSLRKENAELEGDFRKMQRENNELRDELRKTRDQLTRRDLYR